MKIHNPIAAQIRQRGCDIASRTIENMHRGKKYELNEVRELTDRCGVVLHGSNEADGYDTNHRRSQQKRLIDAQPDSRISAVGLHFLDRCCIMASSRSRLYPAGSGFN